MQPWRAVVFDLDDTLYPEHSYVTSGYAAVARWLAARFGLAASNVAGELAAREAANPGRAFDTWLDSQSPPPAVTAAELVSVYRLHEPVIELRRGARALLEALRVTYRIGMVSDGRADVQRRKLAALEVEAYLDAIVLSDDLGRDAWKPSPRPFIEVMTRLSVPAGEGVYVADNPTKDFLGAHRAGLGTIRLRSPDGLYSDLEPASDEYAPQHEISSLSELRKLLSGARAGAQGTGGDRLKEHA